MTTDPKKGDQTSVAEHRVKLNRVAVKCSCGTESELDKDRPKGAKPPLCGACGEKLTTEPKPEKGDK